MTVPAGYKELKPTSDETQLADILHFYAKSHYASFLQEGKITTAMIWRRESLQFAMLQMIKVWV